MAQNINDNEDESIPTNMLNFNEPMRLSQSSTCKAKRKSSQRLSTSEKPNPLDFETFLPWVCAQWKCPKTVVVRKFTEETYINVEDRQSSSKIKKPSRLFSNIETGVRKSDAIKSFKLSQINISYSKTSEAIEYVSDKTIKENSVIVTAYYNSMNYLVKVALPEVSRKVIQALSLCLPYHPFLTKISFHNSLSSQILYDVSKLLPHSNLTEIKVNDCYIPEGNYYVLLEHISELNFLCLTRCSINDLACKMLVNKLVGASGSTLLSLELDSNLITDIGAEHLAKVLRQNRTLLHLNLSGNQLTDEGAQKILAQLAEFPLTAAEIQKRRITKMKCLENKLAIHRRCSEESRHNYYKMESYRAERLDMSFRPQKSASEEIERNQSLDSNMTLWSKKSIYPAKCLECPADVAENEAINVEDELTDPFEDTGIIIKNNYPYYIGNVFLCSLNLAYNNLSYISIKRICEVLKYQHKVKQSFAKTGLLRIVFEGNPIPKACVEYEEIKYLLLHPLLEKASPSSKKVNSVKEHTHKEKHLKQRTKKEIKKINKHK